MDVDKQVPLRVLLVEDNRSEAALLERLFGMAKAPAIDAFCAFTLRQALDILAERRFDLVILDLGLPDVAAELEGLERLRKEYPDVPVQVLTGVDQDPELANVVVDAGAVGCMFKQDVEPEPLHDAIVVAARRGRKAWAETLRVADALKRGSS